jgi:hypothetical protein
VAAATFFALGFLAAAFFAPGGFPAWDSGAEAPFPDDPAAFFAARLVRVLAALPAALVGCSGAGTLVVDSAAGVAAADAGEAAGGANAVAGRTTPMLRRSGGGAPGRPPRPRGCATPRGPIPRGATGAAGAAGALAAAVFAS